MFQFLPLLIVGIVFTAVVAIIFISFYFGNQRRQQWHETARIALEKGQPIPTQPAPKWADARDANRPGSGRNDIRAGLILIAVGCGLYFGFTTGDLRGVPLIGAYVPGFIGVALLLNGIITAATGPKHGAERNDLTPPN
jgi:purine-cytosine permease-like protein